MENFDQNIERYLLGELPEAELAAFENALQSDAGLARSVVQHRELMQRLEALRLRNKVKTSMEPQHATSVPIYADRNFWAMAAILILVSAAIWFLNQPNDTKTQRVQNPPEILQKDTFKTPPNVIPVPKLNQAVQDRTIEKAAQLIALAREFHEQPSQNLVRGAAKQEGDPSPKTILQMAAEAFFAKNYRLAADLLKDDIQVRQDDSARYLRANARFNTGQFAGAAKDFDALKDSFQFNHEARWNFVLCQFAMGKMEKAQTLLAQMIKEQDFPFRDKAIKLNARIAEL